MFRISSAVAILFALSSPCFAQEASWQIDSAHTDAQFSVRHMMISNVRGDFGSTTGSVVFDGKDATKAKINAAIDVSSINTREPRRDSHLKGPDFFDVSKYPTMQFTSKKIQKENAGKFKMIGDLTIHGITKEVVFDVESITPPIKDAHGNERIGASATTTINRKDFGLVWNHILETGGVAVGDDVAVTIDVELTKKAASTSSNQKSLLPNNG